jgi:hypothetical protein
MKKSNVSGKFPIIKPDRMERYPNETYGKVKSSLNKIKLINKETYACGILYNNLKNKEKDKLCGK